MARRITHLTDLTKDEVEAMLNMANAEAGLGISINRSGGRTTISLNTSALKNIVWALVHAGIQSCKLGDLPSLPIDPSKV